MPSDSNDSTTFCENDCFIGVVNCTDSSSNNTSSTSEDTEVNGDLDTNLTDEPVLVQDDSENAINIDASSGAINIAFTLSKEDIRNKLVLLDSNESAFTVVYVPLNSQVELPDTYDAVVYEELSDVDSNYKNIKIYIPNAIEKFPRGSYYLNSYHLTNKTIGGSTISKWTKLMSKLITIKTDAIQGTLSNNKYLRTAFRRGEFGHLEGVSLELADEEQQ